MFRLHLVDHLASPLILAVASVLSFLGAFALYRGSLHLHASFGETFKSFFDINRAEFDVDSVIDELQAIMGDNRLASRPDREKYSIARRYLQNYRFKVAGKSLLVPKAVRHMEIERERAPT